MKLRFGYTFDNLKEPTIVILDDVRSIMIRDNSIDILQRDNYYGEIYLFDRIGPNNCLMIWEDEE